jgi:outer membrane cobalamin receptor
LAKTLQTLFFISILVCNFAYNSHSQVIKLDVKNKSLAEVLEILRLNHGLQFSANQALINDCRITKKQSYKSPKLALEALMQDCSLASQNIGGVYVIFKKKQEEIPPTSISKKISKRPNYQFKGQIFDIESREPLPFSNLQIHNAHLISDVNGFFSYQSKDSLVSISVSHLGYHLYHNKITPSNSHKINLIPSITKIEEIVVKASTPIKIINLGEEAGKIKLNHQIASFLPGTGNNSIFSLLRLQPGILAAGEQNKDYILWGSYKGQSQVLFDGITIFNTSSFIDHIDIINPLIIKDIEIYKGGYNAHIGDRIGGVVNITSQSGLVDSIYSHMNINNQAFSYAVNIPLVQHSSLQAAFRVAYPNIFDPSTYQKKTPNRYFFVDANLKYSIPFKNGDNFSFSFIGNFDYHKEKLNFKENGKAYFDDKKTGRNQLGASLFYSKIWKKVGSTHFRAACSRVETSFENEFNYSDDISPQNNIDRYFKTTNSISELSARIDHFLPSTRYNNISFGLGIIHNTSLFTQDTTGIQIKDAYTTGTRISSYIKDQINLGKFFSIQPGLKIDLPFGRKTRIYWQPRINAIIKPHRRWKINLAYGIYNQFINENALIDNLGNYTYYWDVGKDLEPLQSRHYVAGFSCDYSFLTCNVEAYYKTTGNLRRFFKDANGGKDITQSNGIGRSYGIDFYLKTTFLKQKIWMSYTLSRTEECFAYNNCYQRALHDQRHEFKVAGIFNFSPFFASINYVFGSGFPDITNLTSEENTQAYHRVDLAFFYKKNFKKLRLETGFSILNVFNTQNIRYNNFANFPDNNTQYQAATPFSPTLFVNLKF